MKGRESGMPLQAVWDGFFDPAAVLASLELVPGTGGVAEFGCGYGTFTVPAARIAGGTVHAFDIEPAMVEATRQAARAAGVNNVDAQLRDFMAEGTGLQPNSVDYAMLFNILHIERPEILLREAWRILRPDGRLGIMHWNYDPSTPRGPSMEIRPRPEDCIRWAQAAGFGDPRRHDLKPYHYGIVVRKESA